MDYYRAFSLFRERGFILNIILIIFYSVESKTEDSFHYYSLFRIYVFIEFFFKIGY